MNFVVQGSLYLCVYFIMYLTLLSYSSHVLVFATRTRDCVDLTDLLLFIFTYFIIIYLLCFNH